MKLSEAIQIMQQLAEQCVGDDPDFQLYDRSTETDLLLDPDEDTWDFEILRGDNLIVIEFN